MLRFASLAVRKFGKENKINCILSIAGVSRIIQLMAEVNSEVRTRIAPSPTGFAHVGTAYTALLNFAFARAKKGKFIIRIEDSDLKRNIEGAEEKIYEALKWLGIDWDEGEGVGGDFGPYKLSRRLDIYKEKAEKLLSVGYAYEDQGAIRFKNPRNKVSWKDLIRGEITFPGEEITDFIMLKADGYPTYNFNVVVDDIAMKITHVIRGEDHVSNTPRQLALYKAFKVRPPLFAHHPMLLNKLKKKLSKREVAVDLEEYKKQGYLPEAFVNFLSLLGWSHPEGKEVFDLDEFVKKFTIDRVRPSGAVFDTNKLDWINGEYIRRTQTSNLKSQIYEFFDGKYELEKIEKILPLVQTRIKTLKEFDELGGFFFKKPKLTRDQENGLNKKHLKVAIEGVEAVDNWDLDTLNKTMLDLIDKSGFKTGDFFMDIRVAVAGLRFTPPINESIVILGKKEVLTRFKRALS